MPPDPDLRSPAASASASASAAPPPLLSVRGLVKAYGRMRAVDGIDFDVPERAFMTLLGPSGCGKSTILRTIGGFETPDAGTLTLDNTSLTGIPPERRPVNTVFQSYALFPHLTVAENVGFSLALRSGVPNARQRVARALQAVHMADFGARYPGQLSGGQQQRVAVARAIVGEPRLLLLDEPLSALDRTMRAHLQVELKDLQRRLGIAFIYVTHDQDEAFALSDVIVVLNKGRIVQMADPKTLYGRPADSFVAAFIGGSTLVPGRVAEAARGRAALDTPLGTIAAPAIDGLAAGADAVLVVRPEAVAPADGARGVACDGTVAHVVYQGGSSLVGVDVAGFTLQYATDQPPAAGDAIALALDPERCFVTGTAA